jgi:hypothetical protein
VRGRKAIFLDDKKLRDVEYGVKRMRWRRGGVADKGRRREW